VSVVVRLPEVLTGMEQATLTGWHVQVGDEVRLGQPLAEVETDKASVEYVADVAGVLAEYLVELSTPVAVGTPIALLATGGETVEQARAAANGSVTTPEAGPAPEAAPAPSGDRPEEARPARLLASPLVRRLAAERGVDLATVPGTGPAGRVVRRDLDRLAAAPQPSPQLSSQPSPQPDPAPSAAPVPAPGTVPAGAVAVPHTAMRRTIARRLTESTTTVPHFALSADCRVDALVALRRQLVESLDERVSLNDLVVKAVAGALAEVPELNAVWTDDAIVAFPTVDVAVAVALDGGLVTPVVRDAANRSLTSLGRELRDLAARARSRDLRPEELDGGSFTVSNLGMYGTRQATAIINPPHSGILAVGAATRRPVVVDGPDGEQLGVGTVMTVTLSADHRVVDGATGARWLDAFVRRIENPLRIIA
jgi:pyruvate dehydrogenase E2 component (dihydrolipoamide acetyltransferase)